MAMTKTDRNRLAAAIFEVAHLPGADRSTCIAIAQQIADAFPRDDNFSSTFVLAATGIFTNVDHRAKLRGDVNGSAH